MPGPPLETRPATLQNYPRVLNALRREGLLTKRALLSRHLLTALSRSRHFGATESAVLPETGSRARHAVLSSSDREPARTGTPRANRSEYTGSRRETPRGGLAAWQLTADPSGVRGEEEWLRTRSAG